MAVLADALTEPGDPGLPVRRRRLAEMNRCGRTGQAWEFNEWFHGMSGRPMGFPRQSWSAAMYIYAHECVCRGECPAFSAAAGWGGW